MGQGENLAPVILLLDGRAIAPNVLNLQSLRCWVEQVQFPHGPVIWLQQPDIDFELLPDSWENVFSPEALQQCLIHSAASAVAYVPVTTAPLPTLLPLSKVSFGTQPQKLQLGPWLPLLPFPLETAQTISQPIETWLASVRLLQAHLSTLFPSYPWSLLNLADCLETRHQNFGWHRITSCHFSSALYGRDESRLYDVSISRCFDHASVLTLIPHYRCEPWLARCLRTITTQTRPPDGIVVIDDCSPQPPLNIVSAFPEVTLLQSSRRVGPYSLVQQVIETTAYDWYLFQDADDWSTCDRLAKLLQVAEVSGADLVGSQEIRVEARSGQIYPVTYPLDVNQALATKPGHPLLHPTSLVARSLVMGLGGFATGLRFGGDTEFLLRAVFAAKIVNVPDFSYFRQKRPHSLTTDPATGLDSPARQALLKQIKTQAIANRMAVNEGRSPQLAPLIRQPSVELRHCCGPRLVQIPNL